MKLYVKFLIILFLFTGNACDKKDDLSPEEQLPEATQNGANTAGCLVDGEVFLPDGESLNSGSVLKAQYAVNDGKHIFGLSIRNRKGQNRMIQFESRNQKLEKGQKYLLTKNTDTTASGLYLIGGGLVDGFTTNNDTTGEFVITNLDDANKIISGTFWFDAENRNGDIVEVRNGRFDVRY